LIPLSGESGLRGTSKGPSKYRGRRVVRGDLVGGAQSVPGDEKKRKKKKKKKKKKKTKKRKNRGELGGGGLEEVEKIHACTPTVRQVPPKSLG